MWSVRIRRAVPWALVALVSAGAGLGAGLGLAFEPAPVSSAQDFVRNVMTATEDAGSARLSLLGEASGGGLETTMRGSGVIDFADDAARIAIIDRNHSPGRSDGLTPPNGLGDGVAPLEYIFSADVAYIAPLKSVSSGRRPWVAFRDPEANADALLDSMFFGADASFGTGSPGVRVTRVGPSMAGGVPTTEFMFTAYRCGKPTELVGPIEVWVNSDGQLVQARATTVIEPGAGAGQDRSRMRISIVLHLGGPVRVQVPAARALGTIGPPHTTGGGGGSDPTSDVCTVQSVSLGAAIGT